MKIEKVSRKAQEQLQIVLEEQSRFFLLIIVFVVNDWFQCIYDVYLATTDLSLMLILMLQK